MKIVKVKNYEEMSKKTAWLIGAQIISKPDSVLGLATGSSPLGTYKELIKGHGEGLLDFSEITTVNLDEYRGLDGKNPQSYRYFMNENLFRHINIDMEKTHVPDGMEPDARKACDDYEKIIEDAGGIDIQLLGLGHNGHIGFNEPDEVFHRRTQCVDLEERTIKANTRFFEKEEDVPRQAYTMGIGTIMQAKKIIVIVSGEDKAEILNKAVNGKITPQVPASVLQLHRNVTIVADQAAASLL